MLVAVAVGSQLRLEVEGRRWWTGSRDWAGSQLVLEGAEREYMELDRNPLHKDRVQLRNLGRVSQVAFGL